MKKLLTLLLALVLTFSLVACGDTADKPEESGETTTLTGSAQGYAGPIEVTVTKTGDKITNLDVKAEDETPEIGGEAIKTLTSQIVEKGTTEGVDNISGATVTTDALFKAINEAK